MADPASNRFSRSISSRPLQSPMGPRKRLPRSTTSPASSSSSPLLSYRDSMSTVSEASPMYPLSPAKSESALPPISEQEPPGPTPYVEPFIQPAFKAIPKPAKLAPVHSLNFESVPIQWKGLPLEAARWTLSSQELQQLVSRAIRSSGSESFIRLLSLDNLDRALPTELERLNALKSMTQSKYRFLVHRRTMLLQALNSSSGAPERNADDGVSVVSKLTLQLSQTAAECDELLEELLRITDQLAQISKLMDLHWASVLAIALRKLNKSYGRRTKELEKARNRIAHLEAELNDAWKEAERVAQEMDDMTVDVDVASIEDEGEAVIETAELVSIPTTPLSPKPGVLPLGGTIMQIEPLPLISPLSPLSRASAIAPRSAVFSNIDRSPMTPPSQDAGETTSLRSVKSVKSTKSTRTLDGTRLSLVSAARTRSQITSKENLRIIKPGPRTPEEYPPVPDLPLEFMSSPLPPASPVASSKLWHDSRRTSLSHTRDISTHSMRPRKTSLSDIMPPRPSTSSRPAAMIVMDDIYVRPHLSRKREEIEVIPRTPPVCNTTPAEETIPSMWLHADSTMPKPATNNSDSLAFAKQTSYNKLKRTLSKRYSMPFSLFRNRSSSRSSSNSRRVSHQSS